jgi:hypothetical protein
MDWIGLLFEGNIRFLLDWIKQDNVALRWLRLSLSSVLRSS